MFARDLPRYPLHCPQQPPCPHYLPFHCPSAHYDSTRLSHRQLSRAPRHHLVCPAVDSGVPACHVRWHPSCFPSTNACLMFVCCVSLIIISPLTPLSMSQSFPQSYTHVRSPLNFAPLLTQHCPLPLQRHTPPLKIGASCPVTHSRSLTQRLVARLATARRSRTAAVTQTVAWCQGPLLFRLPLPTHVECIGGVCSVPTIPCPNASSVHSLTRHSTPVRCPSSLA